MAALLITGMQPSLMAGRESYEKIFVFSYKKEGDNYISKSSWKIKLKGKFILVQTNFRILCILEDFEKMMKMCSTNKLCMISSFFPLNKVVF